MPQPDLSTLVNAVVDDPEVKQMVKRLALDALNEARDMIHNGTPAIRSRLIGQLMPALIASLKETTSGDGLETLRSDMGKLFAETRNAE